MKKFIFALLLPFMAQSQEVNMESCYQLNYQDIKSLIQEKQQTIFLNPFTQLCTPLSFVSNDKPILSKEDFPIPLLYDHYIKFLKKDDNRILEVNLSNGYTFHFFKFDQQGDDTLEFKNIARHKELLYKYYDIWSFFHEYTHLTKAHNRKNINQKNNAYFESIADLFSVLIVSSQEQLTQQQTLQFITEIFESRQKLSSLPQYKDISKSHFNKKQYLELINKLENNFPIDLLNIKINTQEDVIKFYSILESNFY